MDRTRSTTTRPRRKNPGAAKVHCYPGASTNPLSKRQKGIICMLAARAHAVMCIGYSVETWRREQQVVAVAQESLTTCCQADYLTLESHFEYLAGNGGNAFNAAYRDLDERTRQARHALDGSLKDRGLDVSYAEKLCQTQYKRGLDKATADQLWRIKYTVDNRREVCATPKAANCPF